jgi:hypothetical protein
LHFNLFPCIAFHFNLFPCIALHYIAFSLHCKLFFIALHYCGVGVSLEHFVGWVSLLNFLWVGCSAISWVGRLSVIWSVGCNLECWVLSLISSGGVVGGMSAMEGESVCPQAAVGSSSQRKKKASTDAAHSAKVERGRVKRHHRQNTLVYYASSRNRDNAQPLETACVPHSIAAVGSNGSNDLTRTMAVPPPAAPMGDSQAASPAESSDARNGGVAANFIVISTSEDGGAETPTDLQEVSVPDTSDEFDEDEESVNPKKKQKKKL